MIKDVKDSVIQPEGERVQEPTKEITTTFHVNEYEYELDIGFISKLGTKNYLCQFKECHKTLIGQNVSDYYDDVLSMETWTDYSKFDEFFAKYLIDPLKTRVIYWMDEDIMQCARLRKKYGIPGETEEQSIICLNKSLLKPYLTKANFKTAEYILFNGIKKEEIDDKIKEVEAKLDYPLFGKPTKLNGSRCTSEIHNQKDLREYFEYIMQFDELEFLIEEFLNGKNCMIDAIIKDGKIAFDVVSYYPNPCHVCLTGKPMGAYLLPYDSEIYKKAHDALARLIEAIPHIKNTVMFLEFVYTKGDAYAMEAATRKNGAPVMRFYYENTGVNWEEALTKLQMGRYDFYLPEEKVFKINVGYIAFMKQNGIIVKKNEYPNIQSKVTELNASNIGENSKLPTKEEHRQLSLVILLSNHDYNQLTLEIELMMKWEPYEYSNDISN
jgi:hypothetical protein